MTRNLISAATWAISTKADTPNQTAENCSNRRKRYPHNHKALTSHIYKSHHYTTALVKCLIPLSLNFTRRVGISGKRVYITLVLMFVSAPTFYFPSRLPFSGKPSLESSSTLFSHSSLSTFQRCQCTITK